MHRDITFKLILACLTTFVMMLFFPLWLNLLIFTIILFISDNSLKIPVAVILALLSSLFISSVDIAYDLKNYHDLFVNINSDIYTSEFKFEPFLLYYYSVLSQLDVDFRVVLFLQSLFLNVTLLYVFIKTLGIKGIKYYGLLLIFPQYVQLSLFLSRQTISLLFVVLLITYCLNNKMTLFKFIVVSTIAVSAHAISFLYITIILLSSRLRKYLTWKMLFTIWLVGILMPITADIMNNILQNVFNQIPLLDRKIGFYMNSVSTNISASLTLYSISILPLHILFFMILLSIKKRNIKTTATAFTFVYLIVYYLIIFLINYPLLPARIGLLIIIFTPYFYFVAINVFYSDSKYYKVMEKFGALFVLAIFIRFLFTNDYGDYNVNLANKHILEYSLSNLLN
ncbi:TPA: O140 family O-antigen polymerase [Escherichia coli]|uniref:O140 family O-antigen polymerase n=1 Tax=Escherichia coli TaxID=562 RepID=UPI0005A8469E|nr:O140 family O-antigen polymerase [Escherichia coli]EGH4590256.1 O140 family O-antigen polymerase [Escherichia coli]HBA9794445.1 O140 family O-antigen polymerase [Escherichia coli]HEL5930166.1 O140 family O-antigen polymerase [Escherichia coli]